MSSSPALAAAIGDAHHGALPGHPHREGLDLVDADVLVVADAALGGAAIPGERADLPAGTEYLIGLVHGPLHFDLMLPLSPELRARYGFATAARTYFGKPMDQLTLAEAALLAGLPQNPYYANPVANFERAQRRQHLFAPGQELVALEDLTGYPPGRGAGTVRSRMPPTVTARSAASR